MVNKFIVLGLLTACAQSASTKISSNPVIIGMEVLPSQPSTSSLLRCAAEVSAADAGSIFVQFSWSSTVEELLSDDHV